MFNKDTEYAVLILRELKSKEDLAITTPLQYIVMKYNLKQGFAEQVCRRLKAFGLVTAIKGPGGGYVVTKYGLKCNLWEIMKAAEPRIQAKIDKLLPDSTSLLCQYERKLKEVYIYGNEEQEYTD